MKRVLYYIGSRIKVGYLGAAIILTGSSLAVTRMVMAGDSPLKNAKVNIQVSETPIARTGHPITSFAPVVKKVTPSVVKVYVTTKGKVVPMGTQFSENDLFRRFFGEGPNPFGQGGRNYRTPAQHGLGSGVIVSPDGYILTNNHVVEDADEIKVALNDKREFNAKVIGRDPKTEVAVIKIDAKDLPTVTIADSDKIEVGDLCLAVGNPFGVGQTVTMGIISASGRGGMGLDYEDFIQTDASINPGNSGGALVDAEGRLIGINTMILSRSGGNQGIGFAIPSNLCRNIMTSLIDNGTVVRGYMGVGIQDVTSVIAKKFNLGDNRGAIVTEVSPGSPAEKAGFQSGDVVTSYDGKPITDSQHLKLQVAETAPKTRVPVEVLRDGKEMTLHVTVKAQPGSEEAVTETKSDVDSSDSLKGVGVADLDAGARSQYGIPANVKGALVTQVEQDSAAAEAGLRQGDVIQEINRSPVKSAKDAVRLTDHLKDKVILLKVWSRSEGGRSGTHYIPVDESKVN